MTDLVVTCPKTLWRAWIAEGDPAGSEESGEDWAWYMSGRQPPIGPGDRLYVVAHGRLRGWATVTRRMRTDAGWGICRRGGAVACTLPDAVPGFRGYRHR